MNSEDQLPDRQIWSRANDNGPKPAEFGTFTTPLIRKSDTLAAVGTMLAARLLLLMRNQTFPIIRPEPPHPAFADIPPEADEYLSFSAGYGEIGTARALRQLVRRVDRSFAPEDDRRYEDDSVVDVLRPGLRYPARSDREFDLLVDRHLNTVRSAFRRCSVLLIALDGTEVCEAIADGAVVPQKPGGADGIDPDRHVFRTPGVAETIVDLKDAIDGLRALNPGMAIVLMVSPEHVETTAAPAHIFAANTYQKAVLRVAMEEAAWRPGVSYFPALEIAASLGLAAFGSDGRSLAPKTVNLIGAALIEACEGGSFTMIAPERPQAAEPEPVEDDTGSAAEPEPDSADPIFNFDDPNLTPEERRAARAAARAADVTARAAARAAKVQAAAAEAALLPVASPPPPRAKRVVPTVVDSYPESVPKPRKGAKATGARKAKRDAALATDPSLKIGAAVGGGNAPAVERKPREESEQARERRERRTARETRRADRRKAPPAETAAGEPSTLTPARSDSETPRRPRAQRQKTDGERQSRPRKSQGTTRSPDAAPESDTKTAEPRARKARAKATVANGGSDAAPRNTRRVRPVKNSAAEKPSE